MLELKSDSELSGLINSGSADIIPSRYAPSVITDNRTLILYDLDIEEKFPDNCGKSLYMTVTIYFWIMIHKKDRNFYESAVSDEQDALSGIIKRLFKGSRKFGIAPVKMLSNTLFDAGSSSYTGRKLTFSVTDWSANK